MSRLSQFFGPPSTKSVVPVVQNGWTVATTFPNGGAVATSGTTTADTYVTMVDIDGKGWLDHLSFQNGVGSVRTVTIRITIDGTVVWTTNSSSGLGTLNQGKYLLGSYASDQGNNDQPLRFNSNLTIEAKESTGQTGGIKILYAYRLD
jgi:hypothetical protein